jgi:S1-C subfamily serine protease
VRVVPRTALGLATLLFFMSVAAAFSGAALFAYYRFELDDTRQRVAEVEGAIADDLEAAEQLIDQRTEQATGEIEALLQELEQYSASGQTVEELIEGTAPSVFFVSTLDEAGQPSVGTAFVLFADSERSFLLTFVHHDPGGHGAARTRARGAPGRPPPAGGADGVDEGRDLALLVAEDDPNLPAVRVADPGSVDVGDRVFAISALGTAGGALTQGVVADVAANGIQHDAPSGPSSRAGRC